MCSLPRGFFLPVSKPERGPASRRPIASGSARRPPDRAGWITAPTWARLPCPAPAGARRHGPPIGRIRTGCALRPEQKYLAIFPIISLGLLINSVFTCLNTIPYQLVFLIASLGNRWAFAAFFESSLEIVSLALFNTTMLCN